MRPESGNTEIHREPQVFFLAQGKSSSPQERRERQSSGSKPPRPLQKPSSRAGADCPGHSPHSTNSSRLEPSGFLAASPGGRGVSQKRPCRSRDKPAGSSSSSFLASLLRATTVTSQTPRSDPQDTPRGLLRAQVTPPQTPTPPQPSGPKRPADL